MAPPSAFELITISDDDDLATRKTNPRARAVLELSDDSEPGINKRQRLPVNRSGAKRRHESEEEYSPTSNPAKKQRLAPDGRGNGLSAVNANARSLGGLQRPGVSRSPLNPGIPKPTNNGGLNRPSGTNPIDLTGTDLEGAQVRDVANTHSGPSANLSSRRNATDLHLRTEGTAVPFKGRTAVQSTNPNLQRSVRHAKAGNPNPDNATSGEVRRNNSRSNEARAPMTYRYYDSLDELDEGVSDDVDPHGESGDVAAFGRSLASLSKRLGSSAESNLKSVSQYPNHLPRRHNSATPQGSSGPLQTSRPTLKPSGPSKLTVRSESREADRARSERVSERRSGALTAGNGLTDHARSKALFNQELQQRKDRIVQSDYTVDLDAQIAREVGEQADASEDVISREETHDNTGDLSPEDGHGPAMTSNPVTVGATDDPEQLKTSACIVEMPTTDFPNPATSGDGPTGAHSPDIEPSEPANTHDNDPDKQPVPEQGQEADPLDTTDPTDVPAQGEELEIDREEVGTNNFTEEGSIGQSLAEPEEENPAQEEREMSLQLSIRPVAKAPARIHDPAYSDLSVAVCIERILGACIEEFREDNDYWIRTWLRRARHSRDQASKSSEAASKGKPTSVFSNMKPRRLVFSEPSDDAVEMKLEPMRSNNKQGKKFWMVQSDRISTKTQDLPNYSHYVSIKGNILAPNDKVMHHWPYISEDPPEGIDSRFHEQYFIDKEDRQRKLRRMLQAETVAEYVDRVLQDIECEWCDVLRFFLEPDPTVGSNPEALRAKAARPTFCEEDFSRDALRWVKVLAELPASEPGRLDRAALLCENFQKVTKFSLWHIARRSDYVKARLPDIKSEYAQGDLTCRVCMRFSCPYHGEIREKDDRRKENGLGTEDVLADLRSSIREDGSDRISAAEVTVHTDIINPPQVNFRQAVRFPPNDTEKQTRVVTAKDRRSLHYWQTEFPNYLPEDRGPYYPCNHPGVPCKTAECSCFRSKVPCEKSCACSGDCPRKFQGCSCATEKLKKGQKLVCFEDERCLCYQLGRECDADLCGSCGVSHVLDPVHRHDKRRPGELCNNASLQRGVRKHTVLGESGVHGLGLYACEDIDENEYVDEYLGEIITINEGERRGAVYEYQKLSYLFSLNKDQDIDGTCFGNKARFINHAGKNRANLYARTRLVNTVYRVGLYATRRIKKGEELFFEYGDKFPDQQLEGPSAVKAMRGAAGGPGKKASAAPHVRNTRLVRDEFYDVEQTVDEVGNRRARKVTAGASSKPAKGSGARNRRRNNNNNNAANANPPTSAPAPAAPGFPPAPTASASSRRAKPKAVRGGRAATAAVAAVAVAAAAAASSSSSSVAAAAAAATRVRTPSEPGGRAEFFDPAERLETYYVSGEGPDVETEAGAETSDFRPDEGDGDDDDDDDDEDDGDGFVAERRGGVVASEEMESEDDMPRWMGARRTRRKGWRAGW